MFIYTFRSRGKTNELKVLPSVLLVLHRNLSRYICTKSSNSPSKKKSQYTSSKRRHQTHPIPRNFPLKVAWSPWKRTHRTFPSLSFSFSLSLSHSDWYVRQEKRICFLSWLDFIQAISDSLGKGFSLYPLLLSKWARFLGMCSYVRFSEG